MINHREAKQLILDLFEEEALAIGGLVALHSVEDDVVWRIVRHLDRIREKTMRRLECWNSNSTEGESVRRPDLKPHPAIDEFLMKLRGC